jgi:hypothetical protein
MNSRDLKIIEYCIAKLGNALGDVVAKFGGQKLKHDLVNRFIAKTEGLGLSVTNGENFRFSTEGCDWTAGEAILKDMIDFASNVAGKKVVENDVRAVLSRIEADASINLYEEFFRLGIQKYIDR